MNHRFAAEDDLDLLAEWNRQLVEDEGHRSKMTTAELRERMRRWLAEEYVAVVFELDEAPVAYAVYREGASEIYLRHLFVERTCRRSGVGRAAVGLLQHQIWPNGKRLTVEVLTKNTAALAFWRSVGYVDYCITLEMMPKTGTL